MKLFIVVCKTTGYFNLVIASQFTFHLSKHTGCFHDSKNFIPLGKRLYNTTTQLTTVECPAATSLLTKSLRLGASADVTQLLGYDE